MYVCMYVLEHFLIEAACIRDHSSPSNGIQSFLLTRSLNLVMVNILKIKVFSVKSFSTFLSIKKWVRPFLHLKYPLIS